MARIEVTEESLRTAVGEAVFTQAVALADKVAGFSAVGPQVEAIVDGAEVSVLIRPGGLDARCACPAADPCPHAIAAILSWVRAGPDPAAELRAELDDVLDELAEEAGDCDPDDGWYPDTSELEDLLDEVEELAEGTLAAVRDLAGHVAERIRQVLDAGNCLTGDLTDALARAEELRKQCSYHRPDAAGALRRGVQQRGAETAAGPRPGVPRVPPAGPAGRTAAAPCAAPWRARPESAPAAGHRRPARAARGR